MASLRRVLPKLVIEVELHRVGFGRVQRQFSFPADDNRH